MAKIVLPKTQTPTAVKKADEKNLAMERGEKMPVWLPDWRAGTIKGPKGSEVKGWEDLTASQRNKWRLAAGLKAWRDSALSPCLRGARPGVIAGGKFLYMWTNLVGFKVRLAWADKEVSPNGIQIPAWQLTPNDAPPIDVATQSKWYQGDVGLIESGATISAQHRVMSGWLYLGYRTADWAAGQAPNGQGGGIVAAKPGAVKPSEVFFPVPFTTTKSAWDVFVWWSPSVKWQFGHGFMDEGPMPIPAGWTKKKLDEEMERFAGQMAPFTAWTIKPEIMGRMVNPSAQEIYGCPWNPDGYDVRIGGNIGPGGAGPSGNVLWGYQAPIPIGAVKGDGTYQDNPNVYFGLHESGRVNLARVVCQHRATGFWLIMDRVIPWGLGVIPVKAANPAGLVFQAIGPSF